uniref:Uncharacterized protein n=1 Tax=Mycena chlorophos TaxID=658473 RepID=A0ABQ0M0C2_MYCCL|nr:predicted protein [Mycena chlorophos]
MPPVVKSNDESGIRSKTSNAIHLCRPPAIPPVEFPQHSCKTLPYRPTPSRPRRRRHEKNPPAPANKSSHPGSAHLHAGPIIARFPGFRIRLYSLIDTPLRRLFPLPRLAGNKKRKPKNLLSARLELAWPPQNIPDPFLADRLQQRIAAEGHTHPPRLGISSGTTLTTCTTNAIAAYAGVAPRRQERRRRRIAELLRGHSSGKSERRNDDGFGDWP